MDSLLTWIRRDNDDSHTRSFISPDIAVQTVEPFGRGIYATSDIVRPQLIIRIPHNYLVNFTTVVKHICRYNEVKLEENPVYSSVNVSYEPEVEDAGTEFYSKLDLATLELLSLFQLVGLFLTVEGHRPKLVWLPFLAMLPSMSDFAAIPLTWKEESLKARLPQLLQDHVAKIKLRFDGDWEVVEKLCISHDYDISKQDYLHSWLCINSRCLYMEVPQATTTADNFTLAPFVDFINHTDTDQCHLKIDGRGFQVFTLLEYKQGDQLFFSYGPHSNEFLMSEYGFVTERNKWNTVDISHHLVPLLEKSGYQRDWLKENDYWGDYTIDNEGSPSFRTEVALAVLQEPRPQDLRRLAAFVSGLTDGRVYLQNSNMQLKRILLKVDQEGEMGYKEEGWVGDCIRQVWRDQKGIVNRALALIE